MSVISPFINEQCVEVGVSDENGKIFGGITTVMMTMIVMMMMTMTMTMMMTMMMYDRLTACRGRRELTHHCSPRPSMGTPDQRQKVKFPKGEKDLN